MTVSTIVDHNDYTGNGVTASFPYTFRIFKKTDLAVSVIDLSENITVLVPDTDYKVTNAGSYSGGNVVLSSPLANGWKISIARELEPTQETDLRNQGKFFAEVHEDAFDKLTMLIQQAFSWMGILNRRAVKVPEDGNWIAPRISERKNKLFAWGNSGQPIAVLPPSSSASDVLIELAKPTGAKLIGLPVGTVSDALIYITPEAFINSGGYPSVSAAIQACADYALQKNIPVRASGTYALNSSVSFGAITWDGGKFTGSGNLKITLNGTRMTNATITGPYVQMAGGDVRFYYNKLFSQTNTAAFLIRDLATTGVNTLDICYNEFSGCKYAILQQGTGGILSFGRYGWNFIHDIAGDAIELNVVNNHYGSGLVIESNHIYNVDGSGPNWGIGIGIAGKGPYGIDIDDSMYVANFVIRDNYVSGCRQCIHVELGRDFLIQGNQCFPDTSKSTSSGIYFAAVAVYGSKRFTIDGITGEPVGTANRFILVDWGVNSGVYAGPPTDFSISNISTVNGDIEISTSGSDAWLNSTIVEKIRCRKLKWRGLPSSSHFSNMNCDVIDVIGAHSASEGSGGGLYNRNGYNYTNWSNVVCLSGLSINASVTKMYVDDIDQNGCNFPVVPVAEGTGRRGPRLIPVVKEFQLVDDSFPGGKEFPAGTVLWKASGGRFIVRKGGAYISTTGTYSDKIKATAVGQTYIQSNMLSWASGVGAKAAGTQIVIPGAGPGGADLLTTITRAPYTLNSAYTVNIADAISTATPDNVIIRAANPIEFTEE